MNRGKFKFIDLFAGIGGFHIAMHENDGECVFASEIDKFARITYEENFKKTSPKIFKNGNFNIDITDPNLNYDSIPEFDILCGGFPCQPFSHAGLKKGFNDTRGTLFFNIQEIIHSKIKAHKKAAPLPPSSTLSISMSVESSMSPPPPPLSPLPLAAPTPLL